MLIIGGRDEKVRLKSYKASTVGTISQLTVALEVSDHHELAYVLRCLEEIVAEQKARAATAKREAATSARKTRAKLAHTPLLSLPAPEDFE